MSHSTYTHTHTSGNKAVILLEVLSDITQFHTQLCSCRDIVVCVCVCGGRYSHTHVVLCINTNGMHILEALSLASYALPHSLVSP